MNAPPHISVVIELEAEPRVRVSAFTWNDEQRLLLWLERRPDLLSLLRDAASYREGRIQGPPGTGEMDLPEAA